MAMIFSRILPRQDVREIGRYEVGSFGSLSSFSNVLIHAVLQAVGIPAPLQHFLYRSRSIPWALGPRCLIISYGMSSFPAAFPLLASFITLSTSVIVISHSESSRSLVFLCSFLMALLIRLSPFLAFNLENDRYVFANCSALPLSVTYATPFISSTSFSFLCWTFPSIPLTVWNIFLVLDDLFNSSTYSFHLFSFSFRIISVTFWHDSIHSFLLLLTVFLRAFLFLISSFTS